MTPELEAKTSFIIKAIDMHIDDGWSPRSVLFRVVEEYIHEYHSNKEYSMSPPDPKDIDRNLLPSRSDGSHYCPICKYGLKPDGQGGFIPCPICG